MYVKRTPAAIGARSGASGEGGSQIVEVGPTIGVGVEAERAAYKLRVGHLRDQLAVNRQAESITLAVKPTACHCLAV
jgi:hypothetical protein